MISEEIELPGRLSMDDSSISRPRITLIILALNEERNLPHVLPRIPPIVDEVLLVDGHSTDNTIALAKELCPRIRIVFQGGKGKGDAIRCGIKSAIGDIVVTLDADGSMAPEEIERFVEPLLKGYQFVKGSRFLPGGGTYDMELHRRLANKAFILLVNLLYRGRYTDLCYGYNAFWLDALKGVEISSDGFEIETELNVKILKERLKVTEVPSREEARLNGKSRLKAFPVGLRILKTIFSNLNRDGKNTSAKARDAAKRVIESE